MRKLVLALALLLVATTAFAQMHRNPPAGMPGPNGSMGPMNFAVSADGSLVVFADDDQLVALNAATGNVAWTLKLDGYPMHIEAGGAQFFAMVAGIDTRPATRTLVAVSASGTVQWSKKLD